VVYTHHLADCEEETTTPAFFLVEKCDKFLFWSKVEATYGLETVITVITVIDSPYMDVSSSSLSSSPSRRVRVVESESSSPSRRVRVVVVEFFPAYLRPCVS
jgi:hypothetical protein